MHSKFLPSMHKTIVPTRNCETVAIPVESRRYSNNLEDSFSHKEGSFPVRSSVCVRTLHCLDIQMLFFSLSLTQADWRLDTLGFLQYKCVAKRLFLDCHFFSLSPACGVGKPTLLRNSWLSQTAVNHPVVHSFFMQKKKSWTSHLYGGRNSSSTPVSYYIWFEEKGTARDRYYDWLYDNIHERYR